MNEENNDEKKIQFKPLKYKWYQFLIIYGIINVYFFSNINAVINNIFKIFSAMHITELSVDGSDFSTLANLISVPFAGVVAIFGIGFLLLSEFVAILLFKIGYFKSVVKDEEKIKLCQYIKHALVWFLLVNVICIIFWGDIHRILLFVFLHLPIPLLTYKFIYLKNKKV